MGKCRRKIIYGIVFLSILLILTIFKIMYNSSENVKDTTPTYKEITRKDN